jgi:hypothetical protein
VTLSTGQTVVIVIASNITIGTGINVEVGERGVGLIQFEGSGCVFLQGVTILQITSQVTTGTRADLIQAQCLSDDGIQLETSVSFFFFFFAPAKKKLLSINLMKRI